MDKRKIREMKHAAGVRYVDFTPVGVAGALIVGSRYVAIGLGDKALYVFAGLCVAIFWRPAIFCYGARVKPIDCWHPCCVCVGAYLVAARCSAIGRIGEVGCWSVCLDTAGR